MALAVVGEAAVGAVAGELLRVVLETINKPTIFRSTLESLRLTLATISPLIEEIEYQNYAIGRPKREIERLITGLEDGKKLICRCSKVRRWNYLKQMRYQKQLVAFDESLTRFLKVEMQALMARDQRETLLAVQKISLRLEASQIWGVEFVTLQLRAVDWFRRTEESARCVRRIIEEIEEFNRDAEVSEYSMIENEAQEAEEEMEAREKDKRITMKEPIQRERMTIGGGVKGLNSPLQPRLVMPPSSSASSNASGLATLKYQNKLCYCGRKAVLCTSGSQCNSRSFYYCEKLDCGYYCETNSSGEVANHGDSVNFGTKKKKNNEFEEMSRKCGSLMQRLHALQGTVSGLKLLTVASVMVCFLSLIMNFVILMYK